MKTKGFTLVELLVVIAILAILATVSVVSYTTYISTTEEQVATTEADDVKGAIEKALILDTTAYIKVVTVGDNNNTTTSYLVFTRDGNTITVESVDSEPKTGAEIDNLGELANRLTLGDDGELIYTSAKGVEKTVDTYEVAEEETN